MNASLTAWRALAMGIITFALIASLPWCVAAQVDQEQTATAEVSGPYIRMMATRLESIDDLEMWFIASQYDWLPLAPPDPNYTLHQPSGEVLPFDWKNFPEEFNSRLVLTYKNSVPAYRVTIMEDPVTRETVFLTPPEGAAYALEPEKGYDPHEYVYATVPDLYSGRYSTSYIDYLMRLWDPARIQLDVTLIPTEYVAQYLYAEALIAEEAEQQAKAAGGGGIIMLR